MGLKQLITAAALLIAGTLTASAQFEAGAKIGFGAHWIARTAMKGNEDTRPHNGYYGGIFATYTIHDAFLIQAEALYASKGHSDRNRFDGKYSRDLRYINVPIYLGYKFNDRFSLMAGPEFGFLTGCTVREEDVRHDGMDDCNRFDFGIAAQFTVMFSERIGLNLSGNYSITRTFDIPYQPDPNVQPVQDEGRNAGFQLGICYKFVVD